LIPSRIKRGHAPVAIKGLQRRAPLAGHGSINSCLEIFLAYLDYAEVVVGIGDRRLRPSDGSSFLPLPAEELPGRADGPHPCPAKHWLKFRTLLIFASRANPSRPHAVAHLLGRRQFLFSLLPSCPLSRSIGPAHSGRCRSGSRSWNCVTSTMAFRSIASASASRSASE
jgi:hypothetical protein